MSPKPKRRRRYPWSWRIWIGYWAAIFVVMHIPIAGDVQATIRHADKFAHFGLYFLLTWLGGRHLLAMKPPARLGTLLIWACVYILYAGIDEVLQGFVGRTMSFLDWLADVGGIISSTVVLILRRGKNGVVPERVVGPAGENPAV